MASRRKPVVSHGKCSWPECEELGDRLFRGRVVVCKDHYDATQKMVEAQQVRY